MTGWLRRMLRRPPRDRYVARLSLVHAARVSKVPPTVRHAHEVVDRILDDKFKEADRAAFRRPRAARSRS